MMVTKLRVLWIQQVQQPLGLAQERGGPYPCQHRQGAAERPGP